jgi:OPA family sugar phosphate sensor protein UhpC-like MFS transporter
LNPRYERWRWLTFGITWLIYASLYLTRQSFSVAKVAFDGDPRISMGRDQYGLVDSAYLTVYMLGQFIFGPLGDRFGPRRILLFGIALSVLVASASGFATTMSAFIAFAVLQGIAQSTGWSNTTKTMSSWFSLGERGRVIGWWCTHYTVGAAIALPFSGWLMELYGHKPASSQFVPPFSSFGASAYFAPAVSFACDPLLPYWPAAFWGPAAALSLVLVLTYLLLRNRPEDVGLPPIEQYRGEPESLIDPGEKSRPVREGSWALIGEVLAAPSIWLLAVAYFSIKLTRYAFIFWGPKYIAESLGSGAYQSTLTAAALPIGGLVGVIGIGYVSDKVFQARRAPATILFLLATAIVMVVGLTHIQSIWLMGAFFFLVGVFLLGPDSMISATAAMDFGTKRGAGTATGFVNGVGSLGGILGGYLPGVLTTGSDWSPLFYVFLFGLVASALLLLPLWRVKPPTS